MGVAPDERDRELPMKLSLFFESQTSKPSRETTELAVSNIETLAEQRD